MLQAWRMRWKSGSQGTSYSAIEESDCVIVYAMCDSNCVYGDLCLMSYITCVYAHGCILCIGIGMYHIDISRYIYIYLYISITYLIINIKKVY